MIKRNSCLITSMIFLCILSSCKSKETIPPDPNPPNPDDGVIVTPVDPATAETIGFFLDNWKERVFTIPSFEDIDAPALPGAIEVVVDASKVITKVPATVLGQNTVSYVENLSDDPDLMNHLQALSPKVIRFPGGSISDAYFWNRIMQDKPEDVPDMKMNANGTEEPWRWNYWYGSNNPPERANLADYYSLLQQTGSEGMITVNYAYARYGLSQNPVSQAAHLAANWVRYDNGRTKYWEIGNENHGAWEMGYRINMHNNKDGQPEYINGQLYAQHAKVFIDSMKKAASEIGKQIFIGVGLIESQLNPGDWLYGASKAAPDWNRFILNEMKIGTNAADFYIVHDYFLNNTDNTYEKILNSAQTKTGGIVNYLKSDYQKYGSPAKPIALTEYNIYSTGSAGSMQQVSFVNGMHTTIVLGEAIKNKFGSAARWDLVNGWDNGADHGMFDKGDEPGGKKWNPRPVFYYMYYFQKMFGDRMIESTSAKSDILTYASSFSSGQKGLVLVNKSRSSNSVQIKLKNAKLGAKYYWYTLTGDTDNGDFSRKVLVNGLGPTGVSGGPLSYATLKARAAKTAGGVYVSLPARSVTYLILDK